MNTIYQRENISYLPIPNGIEFIVDDVLSPRESTSTGFMLPLLPDGSVVMANNRRRGLEFSGGHIERMETSCSASHRECLEETGYWVSHIRAVGYLKHTCMGIKPDDYRYPWPISYQQFYVGDVMWSKPYVENDECLTPVIVSPLDAKSVMNPLQYAIYKAALVVAHKKWLTLP